MTDLLELTGVVLSSMPVGEYDRRVVLLTKERGRITAFAKGARRPNSSLLAVSCPFVCGTFFLYEGRNSYTLRSAEVIAYFNQLQQDLETLCYASYFTELADYYAKENLTAADMLNLLYLAFRALEKGQIPRVLVRHVFELRMMVIDGEYTEQPPVEVGESAAYAWYYVITSPLQKVFHFTLAEPALKEFARAVTVWRRRTIDREFHSLEILETLL
ncbi:MAG: DNA repair protein RecO [Lachnospiraceae bacterium]|nr:DNA repair protein RecO [Lachnospiraceae bacterium]MDY4970579.1 DNA repair protein RecO [Lachnospiraceae bacterium]